MISQWLLYGCLAGAGGCALGAAGLWIAQHGLAPVGRLTRAYRRLPWPLKFLLALYLGIWIAYGSTKAPTNPPPLMAAAPRRVSRAAPDEPWRVGTNENWNFNCPAWATTVEPWERRGAFDDWAQAGEFGVLFAVGRILLNGAMIALYDRPLALVPGAVKVGTNGLSRVWYGRSPWNSEVWTWQNAYADRDTNAVVSVQFERLVNGDRIYRYGGFAPVTSRAYLSPRPPDADSDGDGIPDAVDAAMMDPDADGDGLVDGMSPAAYDAHPLWWENSSEGELIDIRLQEPVVAPAKAVLTIGTLRILLTTNAVYHLCLQPGNRNEVKLTANGFQPVNLTVEPGAESEGGVLIAGDVFGAAATAGEGTVAAVRLRLEPLGSICLHGQEDYLDFRPVLEPAVEGLLLGGAELEGFTRNDDGTFRLAVDGDGGGYGMVTLTNLTWGSVSVSDSIHRCAGGVQEFCYACGNYHTHGNDADCSHEEFCEARFSYENECNCAPIFLRTTWLYDSQTNAVAYRALGLYEPCCCALWSNDVQVANLTASSEIVLLSGGEPASSDASSFTIMAVSATAGEETGWVRYEVHDATNALLRTVERRVTAANLAIRPDRTWDDMVDENELRNDSHEWYLRATPATRQVVLLKACPSEYQDVFSVRTISGEPINWERNGDVVYVTATNGASVSELVYALVATNGMTNLVETLTLRVVDVKLERLYETANPANRIFNPTRKDDTTGNADAPTETVYAGTDREERYAAMRNAVYLVGDPTNGNFNVTAAFEVMGAGAGCPPFYCAFYDGEQKIEGSETNLVLDAGTHAVFSIPAPSIPTDVVYELRGGFDLNENGQLDAGEAVPFVTHIRESDHSPRLACIKGITKEKYEDDLNYIDMGTNLFIGDPEPTIVLPHARTMLKIFYNTNVASGIDPDYFPNSIRCHLMNAFSNASDCYSEWLTHNAGTEFNEEGISSIVCYVWNETSRMSNFFANRFPFAPVLINTQSLGDIGVSQTDTGRWLKRFYKEQVKQQAEEILAYCENGSSIQMPTNGGWYTQAEMTTNFFATLSPRWVPGITCDVGGNMLGLAETIAVVALGDIDAAYNYDAHNAIGRGRLLNPGYRFHVQKTAGTHGIEYTVSNITFRCTVEDLYDFNYEDGGPATCAASVQLGFGSGCDPSRSCHGKTFKNQIRILKDYPYPFIKEEGE